MTVSDDDSLTPAYLRDHLDRARDSDAVEPHPILGEIDDDVARSAVAKVIQAYEFGAADDYAAFEETPLFKLIKSHESGLSMAEDVDEGNISRMSYRKGVSTSSVESYGMDAIISEMMKPAHGALIIGPKGSGKTELAERILSELYQNGMDAWQNVPVPADDADDVHFGEKVSSMLEFAKQPGDHVAVVDEFSTVGTGYAGAGAVDVEQILTLIINAFRKNEDGSTRQIYIGHRGNADVHPVVRENVQLIVKKAGTGDDVDRAIVYRATDRRTAWEMYQDDEPWFELQNIPKAPSRWSPDTNHFATFIWDLDDPQKQIQRGMLIDGWEEFQDSEKTDADRFAGQIGSCVIGECGSPVADDHVFCNGHRGKGAEWVAEQLPGMVDVAAVGRQPRDRLLRAEPAFGGRDELPALPGDADGEAEEIADEVDVDAEAAVENATKTAQALTEAADADDDENVYDVLARETGLEREEIEEAVVERLMEEDDEDGD